MAGCDIKFPGGDDTGGGGEGAAGLGEGSGGTFYEADSSDDMVESRVVTSWCVPDWAMFGVFFFFGRSDVESASPVEDLMRTLILLPLLGQLHTDVPADESGHHGPSCEVQ
jgi:hypothetical protein